MMQPNAQRQGFDGRKGVGSSLLLLSAQKHTKHQAPPINTLQCRVPSRQSFCTHAWEARVTGMHSIKRDSLLLFWP